ncbi:MAG: T9SS type A sorting domain-containing protein, partial [Fimbriimonadaceae bacterium]|nr:T9SS type A sorting domain-containing protein [Chitinophagales bacterium]
DDYVYYDDEVRWLLTYFSPVYKISEDGGEKILSDNISVYPNPASEIITITFQHGDIKQSYTVELFDAAGKKIKSTDGDETQIMIPVFDLPRGIYLAKVISGEHVFEKKIILQ